jgi:hypothetical protein
VAKHSCKVRTEGATGIPFAVTPAGVRIDLPYVFFKFWGLGGTLVFGYQFVLTDVIGESGVASAGFKGLVGTVAAASFLFSTSAVAAVRTATAQPDPFAVLSVMSADASTAAAFCGAAVSAAAAQTPPGGCVLPQIDTAPAAAQSSPPLPIPVPPVEAAKTGLGVSPLLLGLVGLAAIAGAIIALSHGGNNNHPVSPA